MDDALKDYSEAIRLDCNFADAYYSRGIVHLLKNSPDKAARDYKKAVRLDPDLKKLGDYTKDFGK